MHVDLVEALRCPNAHEDGWLVASADEVVDRRIVQGVIGCPQCGAEWRVHDGALTFDAADDPASVVTSPAPLDPSSGLQRPAALETASPAALPGADAAAAKEVAEHDTLRLAALLDLRDARGAVVLTGESARLAHSLHALTGVLVLAVNAPPGTAREQSRLFASGRLPLGVGTVRGVTLDAVHGTAEWAQSAMRALERGGRIVAPAGMPVPADVEELARDEAQWVGELRVAASGLVPLRRSGVVP